MLRLLAALGGCHDAPPEFDVLLVSVDGTSRVLLEEEWESLETIPGIGPLQPLLIAGITDTMASHARLLTGYDEDVTNVVSATRWAPLPRGITLPERLKDRYGPRMQRWWIVNKPHMLGFSHDEEPFWYAARACDVAVVEPMLTDVTPTMIETLREAGEEPFFAFFHWSQVDSWGHTDGERSAAQREALHEVDTSLGLVLDELEALGRRERTRVYVTTDHGFDPGGDSHYVDGDDVFLVTDDPAVGPGTYTYQLAWTLSDAWGLVDEPYPRPVEPL